MVRGKTYRKTYAWQWYLFGSIIIVGPFIAFSALKDRVNDVSNIEYVVTNDFSEEPQYRPDVLTQKDDSKECPYCAEIIKKKAKICRFCGREL
jgi:hypothetical protein